MNKFNIFIDESGLPDPSTHKQSPYFTLCGFVINDKNRPKLRADFDKLKTKYFKSKEYVMHYVDLRRNLKANGKSVADFAKDINLILESNDHFIFIVTVNKSKALQRSWVQTTVLERCYKELVRNMALFLLAKKRNGNFVSEASDVLKDINLYKAFFNYISNGIPELLIQPKMMKLYLTSLNFVTKLNNDPEEQLADLLSNYGALYDSVINYTRDIKDLDPIETVIFENGEKRLFKNNTAKLATKIKLYSAIHPLTLYPLKQKTG